MIGNLKSITIAVPDLALVIQHYQNALGAFVTAPQDLPERGIRLAIVKLPNTLIELITPLAENSSLEDFLKTHPEGGVHHISCEVPDLSQAKEQLASCGLQPVGEPQTNSLGNPVLSLDPKNCLGVSIELEQVSSPPVIERVEVGRIGPAHTFSPKSSASLEGVGGIGVGITVDFKSPTPKDNQEGE